MQLERSGHLIICCDCIRKRAMSHGNNDDDNRDSDGDLLEKTNVKDLDLDTQTQCMIYIRKKALQNIQVVRGRQKYYDAKHCKDKAKYKVGDLVLLKNCRQLSRKGLKLEPNWIGPYRIHETVGKGTYRLCSCGDSSKVLYSLYNITQLKLYFEQNKVST